MWVRPLLLAAALTVAGCAAPTYEHTQDSLSVLSSMLGVAAAAVPGAPAIGLAGHGVSAARTMTDAAYPASPPHPSPRQGTETVYDSAYHVRGYFEYEGETVRVFDRSHHFLGYADASGTYDNMGQKISPNSIPGLLLGKE
jgi:hypothetical protein